MIKVLPMTTVLEMRVGMPKMSIKRYKRAMLSTDIKILVQV